MASVKVKFRPSTVNGREGTLYYQVIHNRVVRQINTEYKLFVSEWDCSWFFVNFHTSGAKVNGALHAWAFFSKTRLYMRYPNPAYL